MIKVNDIVYAYIDEKSTICKIDKILNNNNLLVFPLSRSRTFKEGKLGCIIPNRHIVKIGEFTGWQIF